MPDTGHSSSTPYLIKARGEEVERREDAAVWTEAVLLHDLLVLHLRGIPSADASNVASEFGKSEQGHLWQ